MRNKNLHLRLVGRAGDNGLSPFCGNALPGLRGSSRVERRPAFTKNVTKVDNCQYGGCR